MVPFSDLVSIQSGVPQGTVLSPLMFLLYINDITEHINSLLQLFSDDCLLYRVITTTEELQHDQLYKWATKWQLRFNIRTQMYYNQCILPDIYRQSSFAYKLNNHNLVASKQTHLPLVFHTSVIQLQKPIEN